MTPTETHTISIRPELYERLSTVAAREGTGVAELAEELLAEVLARHSDHSAPSRSRTAFEEIFSPLQKGFDESGLTEEELGALIDREVKAHRAERRAREQPKNG
jgi:predicted CopG family antitoxin